MIIYNPQCNKMLKERIIEAQKILEEIPAKSVFITGSFLFASSYKDIDLFVITRSKKEFKSKNPKARITKIPFNNLHSLFYYSASKSCVSKNILPAKKLRVTAADFWNIVNESIPIVFNEKTNFKKGIRYLVLYLEYFLTGNVLDSYKLSKKVNSFRNYRDVLGYVKSNLPHALCNKLHCGYIKRFFYTQTGVYRDTLNYESHKYLYELSHSVVKEACVHG